MDGVQPGDLDSFVDAGDDGQTTKIGAILQGPRNQDVVIDKFHIDMTRMI